MMENTNPTALYGAVLATILGLVKLYELWRDRFRITISYYLFDAENGTCIDIINLSHQPVILQHWELVRRKGSWPRSNYTDISSQDFGSPRTKIEPHSTHSLYFEGENYFAWGSDKPGKVMIRLHIAGRRPVLKKVYNH